MWENLDAGQAITNALLIAVYIELCRIHASMGKRK